METFKEKAQAHLENYKKFRLGVSEEGLWSGNQKPYPHILPESLHRLNILESYRKEFWAAFDSKEIGEIKLHRGFHHLTSSQALGFNLFFPFITEERRHMPILLQALDLPREGIEETAFEKVMDPREQTNFDFFIRFRSGCQVFVEIKYTESGFGQAEDDKSHQEKFETVYAPMARKVLSPEFHDPSRFFQHYQLLRNLVYLGEGKRNQCLFIVPKRNESFRWVEEEGMLDRALLPEYRDKARILYLEEVLGSIAKEMEDEEDTRLAFHFQLFEEKYCLPEVPVKAETPILPGQLRPLTPSELPGLLAKKRYHAFECGGCGQYMVVPEQGAFNSVSGVWTLNNYFDSLKCPKCGSGFRRMDGPSGMTM